MKFSEDTNNEFNNITGYGKGFVQIRDKVINSSVIISEREFIADWKPETLSELTVDDCELLLNKQPDVIILGTGKRQVFPDRNILKLFAQNQIGVEIMDTAAACRTFNILLSEDRNVIAGLFMI